MTEREFLTALAKTKNAYRWRLVNGKIRAKARYHVDTVKDKIGDNIFDPITAVHRFMKKGTESVNNAVQLDYPATLKMAVIKGADKMTNTGHAQVMRGRMKRALNLE